MTIKTLTEQVSCTWLRDAAGKIPNNQAIVEVGVFQGGSLRFLTQGALEGNGASVFGVDAWGSPGAYRGKPHLARLYGRHNMRIAAEAAPTATLIRKLSVQAATDWTGLQIGLLYIDGMHDYKNAMADYQAWKPHLASDARAIFDDYWIGRFPGVIKAVDELVAAGELTNFQIVGHHLATTCYAG